MKSIVTVPLRFYSPWKSQVTLILFLSTLGKFNRKKNPQWSSTESLLILSSFFSHQPHEFLSQSNLRHVVILGKSKISCWLSRQECFRWMWMWGRKGILSRWQANRQGHHNGLPTAFLVGCGESAPVCSEWISVSPWLDNVCWILM